MHSVKYIITQYWSASSTNPRIPGEITSSTLKFREVPTSFLIGPHFTYRHSRYAPFAQALFGVTHDRFKVSVVDPAQCGPAFQAPCSEYAGQVLTNVSYTKFAMALGGGIDIAVGHGISIRPVQAEYFLRHLPAILGPGNSPPPEFFHVNEFRYSAGISFRFGPHLGQSR